ncbi:hypothetical protein NIES4075_34910 [Tolypothrix sp. NIES-4075]|nr:hypothetical protein [Tolypothrix sp. NIES-4075]GAX42490.1 hypothetical protein NIES4075_34910 [Tolypothrix sp. NIES-4075]
MESKLKEKLNKHLSNILYSAASIEAAPSSSSLFGGLCWNLLCIRPVVVRLRNFRAYAWFRSAFSFLGLRRFAMFTSLINNKLKPEITQPISTTNVIDTVLV